MMKWFLVVSLVLCMAAPVSAQEHKAPPFWRDKHFWIGEALIGTGIALDMISTTHVQHVCSGCVELDPILPIHPSDQRIALHGLMAFAFESGINLIDHRLMANDPNKYWRFAGYYAWPATAFSIHTVAAIHNYHVASECRQAGLTCN